MEVRLRVMPGMTLIFRPSNVSSVATDAVRTFNK